MVWITHLPIWGITEGANMTKSVSLQLHYDRDVKRVQQIRNIGALDGNAPVSPQDWETVKRGGDAAIKRWIDAQMSYKRAVVVLIGSETASRPWVQYEIKRAWDIKKPLVGIRIHGLKDPATGTTYAGPDPFTTVKLVNGKTIADYITPKNPSGARQQAGLRNHRSESRILGGWGICEIVRLCDEIRPRTAPSAKSSPVTIRTLVRLTETNARWRSSHLSPRFSGTPS